MWQTDIIYYGLDLAHYIDREFGRRAIEDPWEPVAIVEFWRDLVDSFVADHRISLSLPPPNCYSPGVTESVRSPPASGSAIRAQWAQQKIESFS